MRVALIEMLDSGSIPAETPIAPEGAINEAVESAKIYCSAEAPAFVNGILDAILRDLRENAAL
jgi:N utilization substance protein B